MKRLMALIAMLGMLAAMPVLGADEGRPEGSLWERLRKKVELLTPKKKIKITTAVGGVRGSLADADDVYWKGEASATPVDADELTAFKNAIALAEAGDMAGAQAAFGAFLAKHPESRLRADAEEALVQLQPRK